MGLAYIFALVVALGTLVIQIVAGERAGGGHGDLAHGTDGDHAHAPSGEAGFWTVLLSLRFWTFAALGFGMSGALIHYLALAHPILAFLIASTAGLASGLFAALAFRALKRGSSATEAHSTQAVGRFGKVLVACGRGTTGQVRVELGGSSIDFLATTDEHEIARGESILVEDMRDNVAHVTRRPSELS